MDIPAGTTEGGILVAVLVYLGREAAKGIVHLKNRRNGGSVEKQTLKAIKELVVEERTSHEAMNDHLKRLCAEQHDQRGMLEEIGTGVEVLRDRGNRPS